MATTALDTYTARRWWTPETVAVITGTNKGIGKEIAKLLAGQGLTVVATARNARLGEAAVSEIREAAGSGSHVVFHELDVSDPASCAAFKDWIEKEYGQFSILVNNAGVAYQGNAFGVQELNDTLATNYHSTAALTETLLPLMKEGEGRIVTMTSRLGLTNLSQILKSESLKTRFLTASSKADIDTLLDEFTALVAAGDDGAMMAAGWPKSMYGVTKLALSAHCRVLAKELNPRNIRVAACCPGWCQTDMSRGLGNKTAIEGADTPVWLALQHADDLPTGLIWGERSTVNF